MFQTFKNAWKVPELKKKLLFTLLIILLYRIGANIVVPFVNTDVITSAGNFYDGNIFQFVNWLSGGAFAQGTLFALSVTPYITASIVMQLLTIAIPALEKISKDGEEGKKKIATITRWVTVGLALITAYGYVKLLGSYGMLTISKTSDKAMYYFGTVLMVLCLCAGASLIMWLAEKINVHGIGNGISMILFANILSRGTDAVLSLVAMVTGKEKWWQYVLGGLEIILSLALALAVVVLVVWFTNSERRIPIQYAKRVVGRKMYGGQSSNLPLKMNMTGVMPLIFASSIVSIPATIAGFMGQDSGFAKFLNNYFSATTPVYIILFIVLIFLFSYFYITISFNPVEVANNIRNNGGSVPGIRPGKPTSDYIKKILNRITFIGAIFLSVIAALPMVIAIFAPGFSSMAFAGSSLLIVVGVALETVRELEAQLAMRNYKGFLD